MLATMTPDQDSTADRRKNTQLRIEPDLWERAQEQARLRRMSVNAYICNAVERQVEKDEEAGSKGGYTVNPFTASLVSDHG